MDTYTIEQGKYTASDARLGRHVRHDSRSRAYAFRPRSVNVKSVKHIRRVQIFDQGQVGSCTGNAALGCLATGPFYDTVPAGVIAWSEEEALNLYAYATRLDDQPGQYPPDDTGSDGLAVAKACVASGLISGYQHAFSPLAALSALQTRPLIVGTDWYEGMYEPDQYGVVQATGLVAGGHEYVMDEYDAARQLVGFQNSWGEDWGQGGRFYMSVEMFSFLLSRAGDVTIFTPFDQPAPTADPSPVRRPTSGEPDRDLLALAKSVRTWRNSAFPMWRANDAQDAVDLYLRKKGY